MSFKFIFLRDQIHSWYKLSQSFWGHHWVYVSTGSTPSCNYKHAEYMQTLVLLFVVQKRSLLLKCSYLAIVHHNCSWKDADLVFLYANRQKIIVTIFLREVKKKKNKRTKIQAQAEYFLILTTNFWNLRAFLLQVLSKEKKKKMKGKE